MRWTSRGLLLSAALAAGCQSLERQELERERSALQQSQNDLRGYMDRNAPIGSHWAGHTDTGGLVAQMTRNETRIREIDEELRRR
ncbi:MAG TPA: hypothetical protein VM529_07045 [Gemmata sp.]|nr:hypothetical protein [Gemmata sp.]